MEWIILDRTTDLNTARTGIANGGGSGASNTAGLAYGGSTRNGSKEQQKNLYHLQLAR